MNNIKKVVLCALISCQFPLTYAECLPKNIATTKIKQSINNMVSCWNQSNVDCALNHFYKKTAVYIAKTGPIFNKKNIVTFLATYFGIKKQEKSI